MKLVSYHLDGFQQLALLVDGMLYDTDALHPSLPCMMDIFLERWDEYYPLALECEASVRKGYKAVKAKPYELADILSPVPHPRSLRDGYAFRDHVEAARLNRGVGMIKEFDQYPVFYFGNHQSVTGPGDIECLPDHCRELDFELECAIVICRKGRDIPARDADSYIGGLTVMNDLSARRLQMEEMLLNLGPAKGKDFATVLGPCLVTLDELQSFVVPAKYGHTGNAWNLEMSARVNGVEVSRGNLKDMDWTFAELIERASYGVTLFPGDIIGSGTVGTGCFLELNGTRQRKHAGAPQQWLKDSDSVELKIKGIGRLENRVRCKATDYSILNRKKQFINAD